MGMNATVSYLSAFLMNNRNLPAESTSIQNYLWSHSIAVAIFAKELALLLKLNEEGSFMAGLLHDIGKFLIMIHNPVAYAQIVNKVVQKNENFVVMEESQFNFSHIDAGYYLAVKWNLPVYIKNTILFHHHYVSYAADDPVVSVVAFANQLVHRYLEKRTVMIDYFRREYAISNTQLDELAKKAIGILSNLHSRMSPRAAAPSAPETGTTGTGTTGAGSTGATHPATNATRTGSIDTAVPGNHSSVSKVPTPPSMGVPGTDSNNQWMEPDRSRMAVQTDRTSVPPPQLRFRGNSDFGNPTLVMDAFMTPIPQHEQQKTPPQISTPVKNISMSDGVQLFSQLERLKRELSQLKQLYYKIDNVPLKVLQNHKEMLKLFTESVNVMLKDPEMSKLLNLSKKRNDEPIFAEKNPRTGRPAYEETSFGISTEELNMMLRKK